MLDEEQVAIKAIAPLLPPRQVLVFADCEGVESANLRSVQVTGVGMVAVVGLAPEIMGSKGKHTDDTAGPIIGATRMEKRPVAAVMLDHEQSYQESRSRDGQHQCHGPVSSTDSQPHQKPDQHKR
nr:hypothetical protein [Marinobacter antarcticus]